MTNNKATILSTGTLQAALIDNAAAHNIAVEVVPFIVTRAVAADELKEKVLPVVHTAAAVVFTSARAVEAVGACLDGQSPSWKIFCIGHATREAVEEQFKKSTIAATADNGVLLAMAIQASAGISELVFFCGDQRRDELPEMLRGSGIGLQEITAYQTFAVPQKITQAYDGILFFSPSAVHSFFSANTLPQATLLFSIGATTTGTLKKYSTHRIIESDRPTRQDVLNKAIEQFGG